MEVTLPRREVHLRPLPMPDSLHLPLAGEYVTLLHDDGSPLTPHLADALAERGMRVVVLRSAAPPRHRPNTVPQITLPGDDEAAIQQAIAAILREHGPIWACLHLTPPLPPSEQAVERDALPILTHTFLLAKALLPALTETARHHRAAFIAVTHLDGALGLSGTGAFAPVAGGVAGVTKTLALEAPALFCRTVDLAPTLPPNRATEAILAELHDPDRRLTEVGWSERGRVTLEATL